VNVGNAPLLVVFPKICVASGLLTTLIVRERYFVSY